LVVRLARVNMLIVAITSLVLGNKLASKCLRTDARMILRHRPTPPVGPGKIRPARIPARIPRIFFDMPDGGAADSPEV
jgi:hypothetical protein